MESLQLASIDADGEGGPATKKPKEEGRRTGGQADRQTGRQAGVERSECGGRYGGCFKKSGRELV